jgi:hypothetical protein
MTGKEFETQFEVGFGEDGVNDRRSQPVGDSENGNGDVAVVRHHLPAQPRDSRRCAAVSGPVRHGPEQSGR